MTDLQSATGTKAANDVPESERGFAKWSTVMAFAAIGFILYGAGIYGFIMLSEAIAAERHWSSAEMGGLVGVFWLSGPISLLGGRMIERFGYRRLVLAGIMIEGLCLVLMMFSTEIWLLYVLRALSGFGKVLVAITIPVALARSFSRNYSLALALNYTGWQLGGVFMAPIASNLVTAFGWREACAWLGGLVFLALLPGAWATRKQAFSVPDAQADAGSKGAAARVRLADVMQEPRMVALLVAALAYFIVYGGVLAHQPAIVAAARFSQTISSLALGSTAGFAAVGSLLIGWLCDRVGFRIVQALQLGFFVLGIGGLILLSVTGVPIFLAIHAICFGLAVGGSDVFWITLLKKQVDARLFPRAWGIFYFVMLAGVVLGPIVAGAVFDYFADYYMTLLCEALLVALPCIFMVRNNRLSGTARAGA